MNEADKANIAYQVAQVLEDRGSFGTIGTDLWVGNLVLEPENALMLIPTGGPEPNMYLDTNSAYIDIWSRNSHSDAGYDILRRAFNVLQRMGNVQLGACYLYFLHATTHIIDMDTDGQGRKLYKITFRAIYRDTNVVS